ncbi:TonB-dependent receptor [Brevundimonas sp. GCM10030266]|uniref:TonB-dependent receptor n=1 Tax=Brevundimonas sp. GCM10030266 TaxID=3273386 RepID=UPI003617FA15
MASSACIRARLALTVSVTALVLGTAPAFAQSTEPPARAQDDATTTVIEDVIVTAQKREQSIQDVPIAVTALSSETLEALRIEGGSELLRAVPNVSFSKSNFSMYNFSIRGVGTKAVSASSDPAVAVSFNNTPLIRNRLFEQEYLDVDRVEVLRGPQGTLYGRNATGGVVNMFPELPVNDYEGYLLGEAGNFGSIRGQAMINIPLGDTFAIRAAGAFTQRDGFDYNSFKDTQVNDRDLWSTRFSAAWTPSDRFRSNLIWEHFEEDDSRSRTGKQLCTTDPGPTSIGGVAVPAGLIRNQLSQGCQPGSLYEDAAYGAPNGGSLAYIRFASSNIGLGWNSATNPRVRVYPIPLGIDPYAGVTQSRDLREIGTSYDPVFRATNDVVQLNLSFDVSDTLTLHSQTAWAKDDYYASQDYARYVSNPIFVDSSNLFNTARQPISSPISPGGIFTDPQLGASDRLLSVDLSRSDNRQWYQEFRLQSALDGGFNFSLGANYLDFKSQDDYFVFNNVFTLIAQYWYNQDLTSANTGLRPIVCDDTVARECVYVDPAPLDQLGEDGHNYFRSKNAVHTRSWAVFGEGYWDLSSDLRLTAGLRYTVDRKVTTPYPSQLLMGAELNGTPGSSSGGYSRRDYPALPDVEQEWDAVTGRLVLDWSPDLSFTNDTLVYASLSRGYKGGGTNPPRMDINPTVVQYQPLAGTFEPEYVTAFEIGTKNTLLDGTLRLNTTAFFYDYADYQVSQIVDRISLNENFDARIWGVEIEAMWRPVEGLQFDGTLGWLNSRIGDGEKSIDVMNRTQGNEEWTVLRPWIQVPSNCIAPTRHVEAILNRYMTPTDQTQLALSALCAGSSRFGTFDPSFPSTIPFYTLYGFSYNPLLEAPNGGRGFDADLSGNELPNSPDWTLNLGVQYTFALDAWDLTLRGDYYRQGDSWARVYNTEYDRLKGWDNVNLSVALAHADGITIEAYVKNVFDDTPITDAFTNSDDTGLTTNVFTLDPRLIAVRVSRKF